MIAAARSFKALIRPTICRLSPTRKQPIMFTRGRDWAKGQGRDAATVDSFNRRSICSRFFPVLPRGYPEPRRRDGKNPPPYMCACVPAITRKNDVLRRRAVALSLYLPEKKDKKPATKGATVEAVNRRAVADAGKSLKFFNKRDF